MPNPKHWTLGAVAGALLALADSAGAREALPPAPGGINPRPGAPSELPVMVVVPGTLEAERLEAMAQGCYVRFFGRTYYEGSPLFIVGPIALFNMENGPYNADWIGIQSAVVGPRATVIAYDRPNFEQRSMVLGPGERVGDFRSVRWRKLGPFENIASLRIGCRP